MATSFEDILNRMRNAPHNGIPKVTNPKVPTKVERDVAAFEARQRAMPKFHFGKGTQLEQLVEHMKNASHPTPNYADPKFINNDSPCLNEVDFDAKVQAFIKKMEDMKAKREQEGTSAQTSENTP